MKKVKKDTSKKLESHINKGLTKHAALNEMEGAGSTEKGKKKKGN